MKSKLKLMLVALLLVSGFGAFSQTVLAEKHFEGEGIKSVKIIGIFCDVSIVEGEKLVFDGLIKGDGNEGDYLIATVRSGDQLLIKVERKEEQNRFWKDIELSKLDLTIPNGVYVDVDNTSGDIKITGIKTEDITISATSGDLTLRDLEADINIKTTSGDLYMRNHRGDVTMRSTSGDQEFYKVIGDLKTQATSGDITIDDLQGRLDIVATSGDLRFDNLEGTISANTTSGEMKGNDILLTGDSRFKSTSGDIHIEFTNDVNTLGFDLEASSGDLEVGRMSSEDHFRIRRGDIQVTGISTSGDQSYNN